MLFWGKTEAIKKTESSRDFSPSQVKVKFIETMTRRAILWIATIALLQNLAMTKNLSYWGKAEVSQKLESTSSLRESEANEAIHK